MSCSDCFSAERISINPCLFETEFVAAAALLYRLNSNALQIVLLLSRSMLLLLLLELNPIETGGPVGLKALKSYNSIRVEANGKPLHRTLLLPRCCFYFT